MTRALADLTDIEESALGEIFLCALDPQDAPTIGERIKRVPAAAFRMRRKTVFEAILRVAGRGSVPDAVTVIAEIGHDEIASMGGSAYVMGLPNRTGGTHLLDQHLDQLLDRSRREALTRHGERIADAARRGEDVTRLVDEAKAAAHAENGAGFMTAADLMREHLPDIRMVIPDLIPEGLGMLVSRPKIGKSWLLLQICIAVATGGRVSTIPITLGDTLYCALEDGKRRLQSRLRMQLAGDPAPARLALATTWPRLHEGGLDKLDAWLAAHSEARFVAIDTLAKIRPPQQKDGNRYQEDYAVVASLKEVADRHHVAIVFAHHDRKAEGVDWLDRVSGTLGLTGAADAVLLVKRARGEHDAQLMVTGRDLEERELALYWDVKTGLWTILGDAEELRRSEARREILDLLAAEGPLKPTPIATALNRNPSTVRSILAKMLKAGDLADTPKGYVTKKPRAAGL